MQHLLQIPPHLKYVTTLPCEMSAFEYWHLQDSVATRLTCDGIFNDHSTLLLSVDCRIPGLSVGEDFVI